MCAICATARLRSEQLLSEVAPKESEPERMHALIDGDPLIYAAGFASDAAAKARVIRDLGEDGYEEYVEMEGAPYEPLHHAIHGLNMMVNSIMDKADATRRTIYLSHPVNYREQMFPEYKTNRDVTHKPYWAEELKDYLLEHGAIFSAEGDEADDALGIAQSRAKAGTTIICSLDKDLDQIPGLHYNWSKTRKEDGVYEVDEIEGLRFFYTQMLTGDGTDNIPGMFRHMRKKATADIKAPIQEMFFEKEMWEYVLGVYKGDREFLETIGPLLWIKRDDNWWSPPE